MADEIKQVLGFEAASALETLKNLDSGFAKLQQNLNGSVATFNAFNQGAGKTVSALIQITNRANSAADALNRLNTIKPPPSTPGGGLPALPGGNASLNQNLLTGQGAAAAMNALLGQTAQVAPAAAAGLNGVGQAAAGAGRRASGFALSLETITRVIGTQLIVRSLNAIRSAVEDSFQGFINFNRVLAEIQTISDEPLQKLGAGVRQLSDDFNSPLLDVAKAKYEALSNGFDTAEKSNKILVASLKFSKVGIASVAQSVDLISTSLNAYGKSADEAETISAKLFKTIELGRVVGGELANAFGRVAPIGKEIGATEDELLAAFSSITIGGVKASEAATQIRATLTALLKPSEAAEDALRKLGFETGEQLVKAKGYQGALLALIGTTDGSTSAIAKLFPNVRALNGVLRETGTGASIFEEHLKEIQKAASDLLNTKFELRIESDAEKVSADINKLKNFFTVDLGESLVKTTAFFSGLAGGADTAISVLSNFAPVIAFGIAALTAYGLAMGVAELSTRTFAVQTTAAGRAVSLMGGAVSSVIALMAAWQTGQFIGDAINRQLDAASKEAADNASQELEDFKQRSQARSTLDKIETDEKIRNIHDANSKSRLALFENVATAEEANKALIDNDKATTDKIIASREKFAQDLKRTAQQAQTDIVDSQKRSNDIQGQLDDARFNFQNRRFNDATKSFRDRQRAESLASQAAGTLAGASKPEEREAAQSAFQRAESFARQAISSAESSKNLAAQVQAERTLENILQKRIDAEAQFRKQRAADAQTLEAAAAKEEARVTRLKTLAKEFLDNSSLFQSKGPNKGELITDPVVLDAQLKKRKEALDAFQKEAFGPGSKFTLDDLFSFDQLQQRLNSAVTKTEIADLKASQKTLLDLRDQIQGSLNSKKFIAPIDAGALAGKTPQEQDKISSAQTDELSKRQAELQTGNDARTAAEKELVQLQQQSNTELGKQETFIESLAAGFRAIADAEFHDIESDEPFVSKLQPKLAELKQLRDEIIQQQANTKLVTPQDPALKDLQSRLREAGETLPNQSVGDFAKLEKQFGILVQMVQLREKLAGFDKAGINPANLAIANNQVQAAKEDANATLAAAAADQAAKEALTQSASPSATLKSNLGGAADNAERIQKAINGTKPPAVNPATFGPPKALGGVIQHFANGGTAKGTDTIATMLSPGETVVNARQSQRFFAQLQSIQAGVAPSFNSSGGSTTINFGDININESSDGKSTGREVIKAIHRELRRKTSALR